MKHRELDNTYLSSLCMELSMLLEAGITPTDGVMMLYDDETTSDGKKVMKSLLEPLESGSAFTQALREAGYFPRYMVSMVEIGEKTGHLTKTLKALSEYYDRQDRLAASIKNAVLYPMILLIMMVAIVLILIVEVLPIFNDTFNRLGAQMSPLAVKFMSFGNWLRGASAVIAIVVAILVAFGIVIWAVPSFRARVAGLFKRVWGHRGVMGEVASMRFVSAMALTLATGLDTEDAIRMAASVSGGSRTVDDKHEKCAELIHSGSTLSDALLKSGIISTRDCRMLALGDRSGMGDSAMSEIASRKERHVQDEIDRLVGRLEPVLVAVSCVFIGIILLSVMLPLMGIMSAIE